MIVLMLYNQASYIIDNGFPHNSYQIPSPIHICFERVEDLQAVSILQFMLSKDFDINRQVISVTSSHPLY